MSGLRRVCVTFDQVVPRREEVAVGLQLGFRGEGPRLAVERIEDFANLGPALTVPAVAGLGKVLRILRAARIAAPRDPLRLIGEPDGAGALLERALGAALLLEVRPRSRLRFLAWTEAGVETVDHVADVIETDDAYLVLRRGGRVPVRLPRERVVRRRTDVQRWFEVVGVERR